MQIPLVSPVDRQSRDQVVADRLRDAIAGGGFQPGARLTEIDLAGKLAVSRSTVRAGLQRLLSEGLVGLQPYSGWHVLKLNSHDAWELFTLRNCLEALASRLAAENIDDDGRAALQKSFQNLRTAVQRANDKSIADADLAIHTMIVRLARHTRLSAHYELVKQQVRLYIASSNAMLKDRKQVIANHHELVDAICRGDSDKAERLAREHGSYAARELFEALQEGQTKEITKLHRGARKKRGSINGRASRRRTKSSRRT
jgi:DNA-binding GntR family transcriptional regulator